VFSHKFCPQFFKFKSLNHKRNFIYACSVHTLFLEAVLWFS
jgi:hypothetical protein